MTMTRNFVEPPVGATVDHILSLLPSLIPSAQRVARICVERPEDVIRMSGADLADAAGTSAPTVSRTCQALGFSGFQHLRMLLVRDVAALRQAERPRGEGTSGWLAATAADASEQLRTALSSVDPEVFDAAADAIAAAPRLLIAGSGASLPSAQAAALYFTMSGRPCESPADGAAAQITARLLSSRDVCLVVSMSGANAVTIGVAAAAQDAGATVIGVTSFSRAPLAQNCDLLLVAGARSEVWDSGLAGGGMIQQLLLSALQRAVAERMTDQAAAAGATVMSGLRGIVVDDDLDD